MIEDRNVYYLGNQKLKKVNVPVNFTKRQLIEFSKCSNDPVYFTKKYIKIINPNKGLTSFNLWDFQEDMVSTFVNDRFTICKIPRQSGKTQTVVAVLLWYVLFHENYSIAVLAHKSSQAREILSRLQFSYEHLPKWLQQGIVEWNKGNIILENGSKIEGSATSGNSIRGKSYNCVTGDSLITIRIGDVVRNISIEKLNVLMRNNNIFNQNDILWENLNEFYRQQIYKYLLQNSREKKEKYFNKNTRQKIHDREPSYYTYMYGGKKFKREYNKFDIKRAYNITHIITEDGREKSDDLLSINFSLYHDVIGKTGNAIGTTTNKTKCLFEGIINFTSRENARKETFRGNEKENINEQYGKSNVSRINRENEIVFEGKGAWYPENKGTSNKNFSIKYGEETYAGTYKGSKSEPREDKKNSGKTSWNEKIRGVSFENEYQRQNSLPETKKIEILTRDGFKSFHGIKSLGIKKLIKIKLDNGYEIKCTKDHKILTDVGFIEAQFCVDKLISIENNCFSGVYSIKNIDEDFVYDILEVKDNNEFLCNGINVHNCVYIDEFAFVPNNIQTEFFATVLPTISAGDETKMIITSTPNGMNMFHKIWTEAVAKKNTFTPIEVHWSQIPGRDEKWKEETIRNSSLIQFQQEYESISFNSTIYTNKGKISIGKLFNELRAYVK